MKSFIEEHDTTPSQHLLSGECIVGIDEAGRGPVLGPMVYGIAYCLINDKEKLKEIGFDAQRDNFFDLIKQHKEWLGWEVKILTPQDISSSMLRKQKYNLNALSHDTAFELVRRLIYKGIKIKELYVDTVGKPEKYQERLKQLFPQIEKIVVESKADANYPIVSAASICAKVTRDRVLNDWKFAEVGFVSQSAYGCGYPSDPLTKQWLRDHLDPVFGFPGLIRFSWSTCFQLLLEKGKNVDWHEEDEEEDDTKENGNGKRQMKLFEKPKEVEDFWKRMSMKPVRDF